MIYWGAYIALAHFLPVRSDCLEYSLWSTAGLGFRGIIQALYLDKGRDIISVCKEDNFVIMIYKYIGGSLV